MYACDFLGLYGARAFSALQCEQVNLCGWTPTAESSMRPAGLTGSGREEHWGAERPAGRPGAPAGVRCVTSRLITRAPFAGSIIKTRKRREDGVIGETLWRLLLSWSGKMLKTATCDGRCWILIVICAVSLHHAELHLKICKIKDFHSAEQKKSDD